MSDPRARLTATEVREAGLADWRLLMARIRARFHTGDFATGMALVTAIAEAHHGRLMIGRSDLGGADMRLTLPAHRSSLVEVAE